MPTVLNRMLAVVRDINRCRDRMYGREPRRDSLVHR